MNQQQNGIANALIFAGGQGTRMKSASNLPKQFLPVGDVPILVHTLRLFQANEQIDSIYLVVPEAWIDHAIEISASFGISKIASVSPGRETALQSIFSGLEKMVNDGLPEDTIVAIHDGVRPIVTQQLITDNINMARKLGSAITSIPAFETMALKFATDDVVEKVVDRHRAYVLQAPQTFYLHDVYQANLQVQADGLMEQFVDQAGIFDHYRKPLHLLPGIRGNVKITIEDDVRYFTYLLETGEYAKIVSAGQ